MNVRRAVILALGLVLSERTAMATKPRPDQAGPVRAVLEAQVAAWNAGDLEAFMRGYWNSDELTFFSGATRTAGFSATLARYRKKYQQDGAPMGRLDFPELDVTPLGADAALVRGAWRLVRGQETLGGLFTLVLRKIDGAWKIIHDHTGSN